MYYNPKTKDIAKDLHWMQDQIKIFKILLKGNWNFPKHIFNKNIERNI